MKVELIEYAGGDLSVVNSARVSFNKSVETITERDEKLIRYLAEHQHTTPFRHNFVSLRCSVPLFLARQLMKHQAGLSWNEESRRYVDSTPAFFAPKKWRRRPEKSIKQGSSSEAVEGIEKSYENYLDFARQFYQYFLDEGVAPELARMVLPQSMMVNFIWSGNILAFAHVYKLRSGEGAQEEAKEFAQLLDKAIAPCFPIAWDVLTKGETE